MRRRTGFTMIELLVVILIILLVSAVVLPQVLPAIAHRQVTEAGRILQAGLVQARAQAVGANAPRGMRLLPDPTYSTPGTTIVAYNRWVPIEPGPDYGAGQVVIWPIPVPNPSDPNGDQTLASNYIAFGGSSPPYPSQSGGMYPYQPAVNPQVFNGVTLGGQVLMVEQAPLINNTLNPNAGGGLNNPTSWFWNVRVGDKIQIGNEGRQYTIVGPLTIGPGQGNPELFVNDGPPGNQPLLQRTYTYLDASNNLQQVAPFVEYLFVVNGQDDDSDGWIDSGWNGVDDTTASNGSSAAAIQLQYNQLVDDLPEWETEKWLGNQQVMQTTARQFVNRVAGPYTTYQAAVFLTWQALARPVDYTINRRPVVSPGARETALPTNVVIDATSWNLTAERSRLPIDPKSGYVDILLNPNGSVVLTTQYSTPASFGEDASFFHFWLAEREEVREINDQRANGVPYLLPMPSGATYWGFDPNTNQFRDLPSGYPVANDAAPNPLKGERLLVTLFTRTGQVVTNTAERFNAANLNQPFEDSRRGVRETSN